VGSNLKKELSVRLELPVKPVVVLESSRSRVPLDLSEIWTYRELLYFLTLRDLKVRYKQTVLGATWVIVQPLLTTLIFTVFLGKLARVPSDNIPYALFAYAALLPWTFFAGSIGSSGNSLVGSSHLITKVYFPRMIIPGAAIGARLIDFAIAFVIFVPLMFYYRVAVTPNIVMLPLFVVLAILLTLGVGLWTSALNVKYRDIGVALPVLTQLWMFASPVVYPSSLVPDQWRLLYGLNPMVGIIEGFRSSLFGLRFNWPALASSIVITLSLLVYSAYTFRRTEKEFADIV
jgi:homopolymeric O-antigen transport system permease protein